MTSTGCLLSRRAQASPPNPDPTMTTRGRRSGSGIGDDVQLRMRPSQGGLDAGRGVGAGKHESEVAIALRQWDQWLARRDRYHQTIDPSDTPRLDLAGDLAEHAGVWDRQHHDAGGAAFAVVLGHRQAGGMAEDEFFQRDSRAEPKGARAQPANRSRRDFEHPRTVTVEAKLGVDGTIRQAKRLARPSRGLRDQRLRSIGKPRGGDINRLLEEWPMEWIGLIEDRQHLELAAPQQSFDCDFLAGDEVFNEQRPATAIGGAAGDDGRDPPEDGRKHGRAVGPDDALATG